MDEYRTFSVCFPDKPTALALASQLAGIDPPLTDFSADGWMQVGTIGELHTDMVQIGDVWQTAPTWDKDGNQLTPGTKRPGWHGIIRFFKRDDIAASIDAMIPAPFLAFVVTYDVGVVMG